uniref:hypothetical protein n=1 Tax=Actinoplanes sp. CA-151224 TaxID=3239904 RepID=UPI003F49AFBF
MIAPSPEPDPLSLRWATILLMAVVASLLVGTLTFAKTASWPTALLAALGAAGASIPAAHRVLASR